MANVELKVEEILDNEGLDLGMGDWFTVEQERIGTFADATDDHQWIHVDPERAVEGPFGTTIAHGYLTLSLVPRLLDGLLALSDKGRGTNYGIDRLRFTGVVPTGSKIRLGARVGSSERRSDEGVKYSLEVEVEVQGADRPALLGSVLYVAYPATASREETP